jgi:hypothetical protein
MVCRLSKCLNKGCCRFQLSSITLMNERYSGGLGLNATQYARFQEIVGNDGAIGVMLGAHQSIGLKVGSHL